MYIVYMREVFLMSNTDTEAQDKKICIIIIYNMCVSHCNANYICT